MSSDFEQAVENDGTAEQPMVTATRTAVNTSTATATSTSLKCLKGQKGQKSQKQCERA